MKGKSKFTRTGYYPTIRGLEQFSGYKSLGDYMNPLSPGVYIEKRINIAYHSRLKTKNLVEYVKEAYASISEMTNEQKQEIGRKVLDEVSRWKLVIESPDTKKDDEGIIISGLEEGKFKVTQMAVMITTILGGIITWLAHEFARLQERQVIQQRRYFDPFEEQEREKDFI